MSGIKNLLRSAYYMYANGRITEMEGEHAARGKKWIIDSAYGRAYYKGYYEPALTRFINDTLKTDSVFVDAGTHAGYFSLIASSKATNGHVYSFEPAPPNFAFIKKIRDLNKHTNWTLENKGLGERNSILKFDSGTTSSTGRIAETGDTEVAVVSLDGYFDGNPPRRIDLVKIDVEGYGGAVIKGAIRSLLSHKPVILLENHRGSDEFEVAWNLLGSQYNFIDFDTNQPVSFPSTQHIEFLLLRPR